MQYKLYSTETPMQEAQISAFLGLIAQSFPENERRSDEEMLRLFENPHFRVLTAQSPDGQLFGVMMLWVLDAFVFVENFAVLPALRSQGLGSGMLQEVTRRFQLPQVLEVEPPEDTLCQRRIRFYERSGFHMNPYPYLLPCLQASTRYSAPLKLMSRPQPLTEEAADDVIRTLYTTVYAGKPVRPQPGPVLC